MTPDSSQFILVAILYLSNNEFVVFCFVLFSSVYVDEPRCLPHTLPLSYIPRWRILFIIRLALNTEYK